MRSRQSSTKRTASPSPSATSTVRCIRSVSRSRGRWKPGRSTRTSWYDSPGAVSPFAIPRMRRRVVCGLSDTIATLPPQSAFTSVDLPTFGRPATATKPLFNATPPPGWGVHPHSPRTLARDSARSCADSVSIRSQAERVRQQLCWRVLDELAIVVRVDDAIDAELDVPLTAAAAGRRGDRDQIEVARLVPRGHRGNVCALFTADAERVRRVLDVDTLEE